MNKNRHIIGLSVNSKSFFANNDSSKAINSISAIMNSLRIQSKVIVSVKNPNCKFTCLQVLQLLLLFPFFSIKNAAGYSSSALGKVFACHKDMFYRFMNDGNVNWRRIIYSVFRQLYSRVSRTTTSRSDVKCVIIDDTDFPKTGFKTEKIGKVFSHTQMKPILGFKAMSLCFTDGVSQFLLDFSLHGEEGKRSDKPQGLSRKQADARYSKERSEDERIAKRSAEYLASKIETAISMLKRSIIEGVHFDYLLVDSWFTCSELLKFIVSRHIGCHLIGMIKMGKTKYGTDLGNKTAPELIKALQKFKSVKYRHSIGYYTATISAKLSGIRVNLHFYKKGKNGNWNALLTSDLKLDAIAAFKLYSRRWVIEVAHKEMKQHLKLRKNQCRDFAGQIAGVSLCVLQYNILSYVKRNKSYETIGGLFAEITKNSVELSVAERIWLLIVEVINVIAEALNCDTMVLTKQVISNDKQINAVKVAFDKLAIPV